MNENEIKRWFFLNMIKIDKHLVRITKKKHGEDTLHQCHEGKDITVRPRGHQENSKGG